MSDFPEKTFLEGQLERKIPPAKIIKHSRHHWESVRDNFSVHFDPEMKVTVQIYDDPTIYVTERDGTTWVPFKP